MTWKKYGGLAILTSRNMREKTKLSNRRYEKGDGSREKKSSGEGGKAQDDGK